MRSWKVLANHCHLEIMKEALTNLNDGEMARLWTGTCFLHQWYFWFSEIHFANCSSFSQFISQFLPFLKIQICNLWNFCSFSFAKGAIMSASWQWDWPDDCRRRRAETSWRAQRTLQLLCKQVTWPSTWRSQRWLITVLIREKKHDTFNACHPIPEKLPVFLPLTWDHCIHVPHSPTQKNSGTSLVFKSLLLPLVPRGEVARILMSRCRKCQLFGLWLFPQRTLQIAADDRQTLLRLDWSRLSSDFRFTKETWVWSVFFVFWWFLIYTWFGFHSFFCDFW